ncbi:MAG: hypothetical protein GF372_13425 [Candidatus Marinimicrobia bacterium]|nr:hypothetical protein [Candidatus Neomarinimicrobiota bacterium]
MKTFNKRFNIEIGIYEAKENFISRVINFLFKEFFIDKSRLLENRILIRVASHLGVQYRHGKVIDRYINDRFLSALKAVEAEYQVIKVDSNLVQEFNEYLNLILQLAEVDLGIEWKDGYFIPTGAKSLDEELVNDNLNWLRKENFENVFEPYEKGLRHYLESQSDKSKLSDVITDLYESLEAMAKIVTNRDKDLSANRQKFISEIKASDEYKRILREYIAYANNFRHAANRNSPKPNIDRNEVESFIYLTGIFLRIAIKSKE